jgi:hypothetical protein
MRDRTMRRAHELAKAPEAEVQAASALARLRRGRRLTGKGKLPDTGEPFGWRLLTGIEEDQAVAQACARLNDLGIPVELRSYSDLEQAVAWEVLSLAMRDLEPELGGNGEPYPRPFAEDSLELRDLLSETECDILFSDYGDFRASVDPDPWELDPETYRAIAEAVKKKHVANLTSFGSRALASFLLTLDNPPST